MSPTSVAAWGAAASTAPLAPLSISRREPTDGDVELDVLYCGICHSDLHTVRDEWRDMMPTVYPVVPGHEIVGRVTRVGRDVKGHRPGDIVAVGCLVDADRSCEPCRDGREQNCTSAAFTYNGPDKHSGGVTYGGYSKRMVVDEHFVLRVPSGLSLPGVAPLLCAGITTYSPMKHWKVGPGTRVGIVGLGGLGHMGVKIARALGAQVVVFTTSPSKEADALRLGAHEVVNSRDAAAMGARAESLDFILDTVSADHDVNVFLGMLRADGNLTLVGAPPKPLAVSSFALIMRRRTLSGSLIGGIAETQEMLDFCGKHGITADVEVIPVQRVNEAYERLLRSDVKYRFVLDLATI